MDFLFFTDFAARGALRDHLGYHFPKDSEKGTLPELGKLGEVPVMQIPRPYLSLLSQNLRPRNHISFMVLGNFVNLFKPEFLHI